MNMKNSIWTICCAQNSVASMKWSALVLLFFCGCITTRSDLSAGTASTNIKFTSSDKEKWGVECVLTNAHVTIQIPRTAHVEQGRVTSIGVYDMAPPGTTFVSGAVYNDYKVLCDITIKTEQEFQHYAKLFRTEDYQEHPRLTMYDVPLGKQLRKDIRDSERHWILSVLVNVEKTNAFLGRETGTFQENIELGKKMVESIKLIKMQSDETDILNPLSAPEVESVKNEIDHLQPYMTPENCVSALGISRQNINTSVWQRKDLTMQPDAVDFGQKVSVPDWLSNESKRIFMKLREGHVLILMCDNRGYVIRAQLDDKNWHWPNLTR